MSKDLGGSSRLGIAGDQLLCSKYAFSVKLLFSFSQSSLFRFLCLLHLMFYLIMFNIVYYFYPVLYAC